MEDGDQTAIGVKVRKSLWPAKVAQGNPCLECIEYIIFPRFTWFREFEVVREGENRGNRKFENMEGLIADYESGALHSAEVKLALKNALNKMLQPVCDHFADNSEAKDLENALEEYYILR